ncbi:MAG: hypothetical protein GX631_04165 [Dehalococcoidales bacterium]|nr:hypothetical protein [Dehalococcoidales bacterium]
MTKENESTMQQLTHNRTTGSIRCLNCFERITFEKGALQAQCPKCGYAWRLSWILSPDTPRIRGPVWQNTEPEREEYHGSE